MISPSADDDHAQPHQLHVGPAPRQQGRRLQAQRRQQRDARPDRPEFAAAGHQIDGGEAGPDDGEALRLPHDPAAQIVRWGDGMQAASWRSLAAGSLSPAGRDGGGRIEQQPVDRHRLGQVLGPALPQELVADRQLAADLVVDRLRDQHPAGLGHGLQPRREIDAFAEQVAAVEHHVAQMHADAKPHRRRRVEPRVAGGELGLHLGRALHRLDHAREVGDQAVAGGVGDPAAMALDQPREHRARILERRHGRHLVRRHQPAVALDVGGEDGRQLAFDAVGVGHGHFRRDGRAA